MIMAKSYSIDQVALKLHVFLLNLEVHVLGQSMDVRIATRYYLLSSIIPIIFYLKSSPNLYII